MAPAFMLMVQKPCLEDKSLPLSVNQLFADTQRRLLHLSHFNLPVMLTRVEAGCSQDTGQVGESPGVFHHAMVGLCMLDTPSIIGEDEKGAGGGCIQGHIILEPVEFTAYI